jgi:hypothetical protein
MQTKSRTDELCTERGARSSDFFTKNHDAAWTPIIPQTTGLGWRRFVAGSHIGWQRICQSRRNEQWINSRKMPRSCGSWPPPKLLKPIYGNNTTN